MQRFVVSTIGTSILTNSIDRGNPAEGTWFGILRDSANKTQDEITDDELEVIDELARRALEKLNRDDVETNRRSSAELNGVYGIYDGTLPNDNNDLHYLVCTDTVQGQKTGQLIQNFLASKGFTVNIVTPPQLSTKDTQSFAAGTKWLINWLDETLPKPNTGYQVIFNLVGGFKSLQGYMQTFGTFYADETVYIFEGSSDLIKIPRLPIQIDNTVIENQKIKFALMNAGQLYPINELEGIPETLLELVEDDGNIYAGLSTWGELVWNRTKSDLLSQGLLQFPRLVYQQSFINDCNNLNGQQWTKLQETLAKVTAALENSNGDISQLNNQVSGLNFEQLRNLNNICTLRITQGVRVSCKITDDGLTLRRYGSHDYVYGNP